MYNGSMQQTPYSTVLAVNCVCRSEELLYLMTFADNLTSFHCGVDAVGHMEQENP